MKRWKRILLWLGGAAIVLPLVAVLTAPLWQRPWIGPAPDVRLQPHRPVVDEKQLGPESAFGLFRQAEKALVRTWTPDEVSDAFHAEVRLLMARPWSEQDFPEMVRALAANGTALDLARRAVEAPSPQVPTVTSPDQTIDYLTSAQQLAWLLEGAAARSAAAGEYDAAVDDLLHAMDLGDLISRGGPLINMVMEAVILRHAAEKLRFLVLEQAVPEAVVRRALDRMDELERELEPFDEILRHEALQMLSVVDIAYGGKKMASLQGMPRPGRVRLLWAAVGSTPKSTRRNLESVFARLVLLAEQGADGRRMDDEIGKVHGQFRGWPSLVVMRDPLGFILMSIATPVVGSVFDSRQEAVASLRATRVVLAISLFQRENGRLPRSLEELTPKFLAEVPADPFDSGALRYRAETDGTWLVYSVGRNRMDDGGVEGRHPSGAPARGKGDLVFPSDECARQLETQRERY